MKIARIISLVCIMVFIVGFIFSVLTPIEVFAAGDTGTKIKFVPSTTIPGSEFVVRPEGVMIDSGSLSRYIIAIYNYGIGLVSVLAVVMIMFGGFKWIFAAGNATKIGDAKSTIISALIGLFLALGSWMLLNTINPALTSFKGLYAPEAKIASCPWHVNTCDLVNNFFHYIVVENANMSDSALNDSIEFYSKKFGLEEGIYDKARQLLIQKEICSNKEETLLPCSIPSGVCLYDDKTGCKSIASIKCDGDDSKCRYPGFDKAFCQTHDKYCSLGVRGSKCKDNEECRVTGLTCVKNKCFKPGKEGESCERNDECIEGLVCSDDGKDIITPDKCVPAVKCSEKSQCLAANYAKTVLTRCVTDGISNFGFCDCTFDRDCDPGYRCVDVKRSSAEELDKDVCLPSSYR